MAKKNQEQTSESKAEAKTKKVSATTESAPKAEKKSKSRKAAPKKVQAEVSAGNTEQQVSKSSAAKVREPQMVTVNGQKVTHGHVFQGKNNPENNYFTARLDGTPLKTKLITADEARMFMNKEIGVADLMAAYHPTKLMAKVPEVSFTVPNVIAAPDGLITVDKFNIYKESNPERPDFGKYKMYAQLGDVKMSMLAPQKALDEFFDKVKTPGQLVEEHFGERLHLPSAYEKYVVPEGITVDKVHLTKGSDGHWDIKAKINDSNVGPKAISYDDGFSFFKTKSATESQLAVKYFGAEIHEARTSTLKPGDGVKQNNTSSLKR